MKKSLLATAALALGLTFSNVSNAQLADGSVAPNFTSTDINGNTWDLYTVLAQGKTVVIDISATWCGPCWAYHTSGALDNVMKLHGPTGMAGVNTTTTNDMMVFFVEGDNTTNTACLTSATGCNSTTQGNWVTGTLSPILDDATIANSYAITYFPSVFMVCPDKIVRLAGQLTEPQLYAMKQQYCFVATAANDASLMNTTPGQILMSCDSVNPTITLENVSTTALTSATITYQVDGVTQKTYNWTGNLAAYATASITGIKLGSTPGNHTITATVSNPNGGADAVAANDAFTNGFTIFSTIGGAPVTEGFQATYPATGWSIQNGGDQTVTWIQATNCGGFGTSTQSASLRFYDSPDGDVDALLLPPQSTSGMSSAQLKFDVAYAGYTASSPETDKLVVKLSKNCGASWYTIYTKSGNTLKTASPTTADFTPTAAQWRTETVNIPVAYVNQPNLLMMFEGTSNYGNNLYIDNINLLNTTGIKTESNFSNISLYPNPASSEVNLELNLAASENITISIYNNLGELVSSEAKNSMPVGESRFVLSTENLSNGIYSVVISAKEGNITKKLSINK